MLEDLTLPKKVRPCKVRDVKADLQKSDVDILESALMSEQWPVKTLERSLGDKGIILSESVIRKHRQRSCGCFER
jgi:hypothetical protein